MKRLSILLLFVVFAFQNVWSQSRNIEGIVADENGVPLVGVTIFIKGTTNGTASGSDGDYSLEAQKGDVVVFQYIGMETLELTLQDQTTLNVNLKPSNVALNEVVAIGYGSVKRKELTGATASVSSDELTQDRVVTSLADALKGKVSGVRITQNSGGPGAGSTINIRGATSVFGDNQPLFVVDGFPVQDFDLNADDIAEIDVLKDASSTAIYGSRGANGVIIVTTKKGKKGKPKIEVNAKFGISDLSRRVDMIDNVEWVKQIYEQNLRYTKANEFDGTMYGHLDYYQDIEGNIWTLPKTDFYGKPHPYKNHENYRDSINTDWQDETLRTAQLQDYRINFSSGTDRSSYNISLNFIDQEGLVPNNKVQKIIGRLNMSQKLTDRVEILSNTYFTKEKDQGFRDVINVMLLRPPVQPAEGEWDSRNIPGYNDQGLLYGPVEQTEAIDRDTYYSTFQSNLSLNFDITQKLRLSVGGSYRNLTVDREFYTPKTTPYGFNYGGIGEYRHDVVQNITNENYLTYTENIDDHKISVMAGNSIEWNEHKWFGVQNRSFDLENLAFYGMNGGTEPQIPYLDNLQSSLSSFYGRINYSYKDRYFLSATARTDGSSRLAEGHKWDSFQSVGAAWRLSEEEFTKGIEWFPTTKLRATWGVAGKQSISPYQSLSVIRTGNGTADGVGLSQLAYPVSFGNTGLSWEQNEEINFGVDMYFDNGRHSFTADAFRKTTVDLPNKTRSLAFISPSPASGTPSPSVSTVN